MPLIIPANSITGGFEVANSLRFDDGSSDYLNKTFGTPTSTQKGTHSFWFKLGDDFTSINFLGMWDNFYSFDISLDSSSRFRVYSDNLTPTKAIEYVTNRVLRDPSAWYHAVVSIDTTQSGGNRVKIYINGVQETSFATTFEPNQNDSVNIVLGSHSAETSIGRSPYGGGGNYYSGYIAEYVYVDGQQLDPTSFGEFDADTGIWKPIDVSELTFGTNGFYLDFENSGSLGADVSGNGNNFTVNNLTSIDQTTDTPTNNFATLNPLDNYYFNSTFSEGNLKVVTNSGNFAVNTSTFWLSGGKWYWEVKVVTSSTNDMIGIANAVSTSTSNYLGANGNGYAYRNAGDVFNTGGSAMSGFGAGTLATYGNGDILMIALDLTNSKLYFGKNGTWGNSGDPTSGSTGTGAVSIVAVGSTPNGAYTPALSDWNNVASLTAEINFGSPSFSIASGNSDGRGYGNFEYSVPSGYYALNTKNLAEYG